MKHTLEVYSGDELIFFSDSKWLHPLFELEIFLMQQNFDPASLILEDKIVGRAAALLQLHLGIKSVRAGLMSKLAQEVFDHFQVKYEYEKLIERIQCRTEELLKNEFDPNKVYLLIKKLRD